jgi:hypothetical protein
MSKLAGSDYLRLEFDIFLKIWLPHRRCGDPRSRRGCRRARYARQRRLHHLSGAKRGQFAYLHREIG